MIPSPAAPAAVLEPWIAARLRHPRPEAVRSDYDLNPELARRSPADAPLARAAVLVPLVQRQGGLNVVLTRRADTLTRHSGQIAFPGGRADPGETPTQTALREACEEIALDPAAVRVAGLGDLYRTVSGFEITPVVGFLDTEAAMTAAAAEVAEIFETPFAFLMNPANHLLQSHVESGRRFYAMPYETRLIWGATAGMLRALSERLFGPAATETQPT